MYDVYILGDRVISDVFQSAIERSRNINESSKYKPNQIVRIKYDISKIISILYPTYRYRDASLIANKIAGEEATIISADRLTDDNGKEGTYYTVEPKGDSGFYVLPEELILEVTNESIRTI